MPVRLNEQELQDKWDVQSGQVFVVNNSHKIMCGDSCSSGDVGVLMGSDVASVGFFDPPYGINFQSNFRSKTTKFSKLKNDTFVSHDWIPIAKQYIVNGGAIYVCTHWRVYQEWLSHLSDQFLMKNLIVLKKSGGGIGDLKGDYIPNYELLMFMTNGRHILRGKRCSNVWDWGGKDVNSYIHPTQKPVQIVVKSIEKSSDIGDVVIDFFGGSGTTLQACNECRRVARIMEIDPKWVSVSLERFSKLGYSIERMKCA